MTDLLRALLADLPGLYVELEDSALPVRTGQPPEGAPDPLSRPTPGRLDVMEHRHKLLRGLRWWVDAVRDPDEWPNGERMGDSPLSLCGWLAGHLDVMAPEDQTELHNNLLAWWRKAWKLTDRDDAEVSDVLHLPPEAYDRQVRVKDAAEALGCTVRTIRRRVPVERRQGGLVRLGDAAPRCGHCDLIVGQCEHTRTPTRTH